MKLISSSSSSSSFLSSFFKLLVILVLTNNQLLEVVRAEEHYWTYCVNEFWGLNTKVDAFQEPVRELDPPESQVVKPVGDYVGMSPALTAFSDKIPDDEILVVSATIGYGPAGKTFPLILCTSNYTDCACAAFVDDTMCNSCEICDEARQGTMSVSTDCSNVKGGACNMECQNTNNMKVTCQYSDPMTCVGVDIPTLAPDDDFVPVTVAPDPSDSGSSAAGAGGRGISAVITGMMNAVVVFSFLVGALEAPNLLL